MESSQREALIQAANNAMCILHNRTTGETFEIPISELVTGFMDGRWSNPEGHRWSYSLRDTGEFTRLRGRCTNAGHFYDQRLEVYAQLLVDVEQETMEVLFWNNTGSLNQIPLPNLLELPFDEVTEIPTHPEWRGHYSTYCNRIEEDAATDEKVATFAQSQPHIREPEVAHPSEVALISDSCPKNSGKAPSMQFYCGDWLRDTALRTLSYHDRGVWMEMLCHAHFQDERGVLTLVGKPIPPESMARLLGLDIQTFNQTLKALIASGVAKVRDSDGAIYSKRMVNDERLSQIRRAAGGKGGNPALLNQKPTTPVNQKPTTPVKEKPTPSASVSTAKKREVFTSPSLSEWIDYGATLTPPLPKQEAENIWNHYTAKGWRIGKEPMKDWKASLRTCHGRWRSEQGSNASKVKPQTPPPL